MFGRPKPYDRQQTLASAEKARMRGRTKKAIGEYRKVLAQTPGDHLVLGKLAPLLAQRGLAEEAMRSFEGAAEGLRKEGRDQRAIAVYLLAAEHYPRDQSLWERIAKLQLERGTRADAVRTLLRAGRSSAAARTGPSPSRCCARRSAWRLRIWRRPSTWHGYWARRGTGTRRSSSSRVP